MSNKQISKRIFYLDQLRALAILAIVICHVALIWQSAEPGSFNKLVSFLFNFLGRYGVPIFLMLTGVLLLNKNYTIDGFLKRRFPRIIYPFIFWLIICVLFIIVTQKSYPYFDSIYTGVYFSLKTLIVNRWYVWMLIGVYLFMPIINYFVKGEGLKGVKYYLILWIISSLFFCMTIYFDISVYYLDLSFFVGPIGYILLGYYLHNKKFNYSPKILMFSGLLLFFGAYLLKVFLMHESILPITSFKYYIFLVRSPLEIDIFTMLQVTGLFLFIKYFNINNVKNLTSKIAQFLEKGIIGKLTMSLSKASYGIYLNHMIIIGLIKLLELNLLRHGALKWIPFLTIIVLFISWGIILLMNKIPILNKFSGYH
jgi:surface polysaccharide O-acyltransferase-like enzyme